MLGGPRSGRKVGEPLDRQIGKSGEDRGLTSELFSKKIQPLLARISISDIRSCIQVSRWYASRIRQGYRPHPRHLGGAGGTR